MPNMRKDVDYRSVYNPDDVGSLLRYAKTMEHHTIGELCVEEDIATCDIDKDKGRLGQVIEYGFFFIERNSSPEPDLGHGIELKTTPVRVKKDDSRYPKERLSLALINYNDIYDGMNFDETLHHKLNRLLIAFYIYDKDKKDLRDQYIDSVAFWTIPEEDLQIIKQDWSIIRNLIVSGRADELSCRLTTYLEPAPKGKNKNDKVSYGEGFEAMKRAFALKPCYINRIYHSKNHADHIPADFSKGFDYAILSRFKRFEGLLTTDIESQLGVDIGTSKQRFFILANYMVCGRNAKKIDELEKAGIMMKTVCLQDGRPTQPMTFPAFDYFELSEEDWEDSEFRMMLDRKILLIIFDILEDGAVMFRKAALWLVPESDLVSIAETWEDTKSHILDQSYSFITHQKYADIAFVKPHSKTSKPVLCPDGNYRKVMGFAFKQDYVSEIVKGL